MKEATNQIKHTATNIECGNVNEGVLFEPEHANSCIELSNSNPIIKSIRCDGLKPLIAA